MSKLSRAFGDITITATTTETKNGVFWQLSSSGNCPHIKTRIIRVPKKELITIKVKNRMFGFASIYWSDILPINEPFEIKLGIPTI